jgi:hypothetical protein
VTCSVPKKVDLHDLAPFTGTVAHERSNATEVSSGVHQQVDRLVATDLGKPTADAVGGGDIDDRSARAVDMGAVQIPDDNASAALH